MSIARRTFLSGAAALAAAPAAAQAPRATDAAGTGTQRYGLVGRMTARPGQRNALTRILIDGVAGMPGCLSYVVAHDAANADLIWITEAWESKAAHAASLGLPSVRDAIARGRPLIAGMEMVAETRPIGGTGLAGAPGTPGGG